MIKLEIELAKCRERTTDESIVLLMMQAKVDVLREWGNSEAVFYLDSWVRNQRLKLREQVTELVPA